MTYLHIFLGLFRTAMMRISPGKCPSWLFFFCCCLAEVIPYQQKIENVWKVQRKHSQLICWSVRTDSAPTTSPCSYLMQLSCAVLRTKNVISEIKYTQQNVQECVIFQIVAYNPPQFTLCSESMGILCVFINSLLASCKICNRSPDKKLSAKTKCQKGGTESTLSCHLLSYRKYASIVWTIFTDIKRNLILNFKWIWFTQMTQILFRLWVMLVTNHWI